MVDNYVIKDTKKAIRLLKQTLKGCKRGDERYKEVKAQISEYKSKLETLGVTKVTDPIKSDLMEKILKFYHDSKQQVGIDLSKFNILELEFHLLKITGKVKTKDDFYKFKNIEKPEAVAVPTKMIRRKD